MLLKILGMGDMIAGFLVILGNVLGIYYLILKGFVFLLTSKGTSVLSWVDFLLGIILFFSFSQVLSMIAFLYLLVKALLSFM